MRKLICPECKEPYYSAASLEHLVKPTCDCGGRLKEDPEKGGVHHEEHRHADKGQHLDRRC